MATLLGARILLSLQLFRQPLVLADVLAAAASNTATVGVRIIGPEFLVAAAEAAANAVRVAGVAGWGTGGRGGVIMATGGMGGFGGAVPLGLLGVDVHVEVFLVLRVVLRFPAFGDLGNGGGLVRWIDVGEGERGQREGLTLGGGGPDGAANSDIVCSFAEFEMWSYYEAQRSGTRIFVFDAEALRVNDDGAKDVSVAARTGI